MKLFTAFAALVALAPHAAAQQPAARPHPADPATPAPAMKYESAFSGYRGFRDEPLAPWREVNDEMGRLGGHAGHLRGASPAAESRRPERTQHAPARSPDQGKPAAGSGHGMRQ